MTAYRTLRAAGDFDYFLMVITLSLLSLLPIESDVKVCVANECKIYRHLRPDLNWQLNMITTTLKSLKPE